MEVKPRTLTFAGFVLTAIVCLILLFVGYVFIAGSWSPALVVILLLLIVAMVSLALNWYQGTRIATLTFAAQAAGAGENNLYSDLYQNSPVPYLRTDRDGKILHANAAAVRFFTLTNDELFTQNVFSFIDTAGEDTAHPGIGIVQLISLGQHFINEVEVQCLLPNGSVRWAKLSAFPHAHGKERLITLIDFTEEKAIDIAKSEFVSLASHQLRTPISAMLWNIELLAQLLPADTPAAVNTYVAKVKRSGERMNMLVDGFLDTAKLEMGTFASKLSTVEVNAFVQSILDEFAGKVSQKALQYQVTLLANPREIVTDRQLLQIIITNLASNAIKYTPERGTVTITLSETTAGLEFRVRDSGIGIPADDQPKLFSKLYRARNTKTYQAEGTGLGLYVVKQAVELLSGTINFSSAEGQGTEFVVTLPGLSLDQQ